MATATTTSYRVGSVEVTASGSDARTDASGNVSIATVEVKAPFDRGKK